VCFPTGKKVYVAQFRANGRSRRMAIGEHGRLTLDEARSEAKKLLGAIESGADPIAQRRAARAARTLREVANDFMRLHIASKRKSRTHEEYERLLKLHILPALGARRLVDITRSDVAKLHAKLSNRPFMANRCLALVSSFWNWAARREEVAFVDNPAKGVERNPERGRERYLTSEELARLGDALCKAETEGLPWAVVNLTNPKAKHAPKPEGRRRLLDAYAIAAIRLLILTGARLREILNARWEHVDFERGIIHLPDSKTGAKPIYLSAAAQTVLTGLARLEGNSHIIPGERDGAPRVDLKKPWAAITKAAELQGLRIHDLRHSFASFGAGASLGLPIIGKLLGHANPATPHRYAHLDADPMRRAVEIIGSKLASAMDGRQAKVLPFEKGDDPLRRPSESVAGRNAAAMGEYEGSILPVSGAPSAASPGQTLQRRAAAVTRAVICDDRAR
jgi:integrase